MLGRKQEIICFFKSSSYLTDKDNQVKDSESLVLPEGRGASTFIPY